MDQPTQELQCSFPGWMVSASPNDWPILRSHPDGDETADKGAWMSIWVDDVDAVHERCVAEGLDVTHLPTDEPWGVRELPRSASGRSRVPHQHQPRALTPGAPIGVVGGRNTRATQRRRGNWWHRLRAAACLVVEQSSDAVSRCRAQGRSCNRTNPARRDRLGDTLRSPRTGRARSYWTPPVVPCKTGAGRALHSGPAPCWRSPADPPGIEGSGYLTRKFAPSTTTSTIMTAVTIMTARSARLRCRQLRCGPISTACPSSRWRLHAE
jgi:hypothetical protein